VLSRKSEKPGVIDACWLRQLCLSAGADDVAFASVENPDLASEREHVADRITTRAPISTLAGQSQG
jgi:hypothetical protein